MKLAPHWASAACWSTGRTAVQRLALAALVSSGLAGCAGQPLLVTPPTLAVTPISQDLESLPPPRSEFVVAVYGFKDLTGQRKPSDTIADLSTAVTQGGGALLVDALMRVAKGKWFRVAEREGLPNLLQERQLIRATRAEYKDETPMAPLLFAGAMLEGGIISYDANTSTSGFGARFLGIGGNADARIDEVTVNLRLVSVQTGQVMRSVTIRKSVASTRLQGNVYRYTSENRILELEGGVSQNEPMQFAVRQAIQKAVYALVMEGAETGLWEFADPVQGHMLLQEYKVSMLATQAAPRPGVSTK
ncbi:CsgG/HfaB family protein [Polaromonas sp.]|uniref:CsgG/HfaB family protein n=1 Tax=Polaromonas sp. TaxID=1869339 RepID=UPI0013B9B323|nr:CsgG/HfaB family protein [Polaromonas sp.]NDP64169.1 curli production assembly protein CsgG [Polaromonas sp.]